MIVQYYHRSKQHSFLQLRANMFLCQDTSLMIDNFWDISVFTQFKSSNKIPGT